MKRRIAMISEHASPLTKPGGADSGGQNVYVAQLACHLARMGYQVDVFTRRDSAACPELVTVAPGVRVVHVPAGPPAPVPKEELLPWMDEFRAFILRWMRGRRQRYDLIHANFWMSALVAVDVKRALGTPVVVTFHALGRVRRQFQGDADRFPDERFAIEDRIVAEADHILAECPQDESDLVELYRADPAKISIVPCGFDPDELSPVSQSLARATLGVEPSERILLQLGRLVPRKGIDTVIQALAQLVHQHRLPARLLVVGGESDEPDEAATPEIGRLREVAAAAGVAEQVTFVGRRPRAALKFYYSAADLFLTTPWYEPFGITPVEAMACGTPVIGSDVGGIKYTVLDGVTGFLVPPRAPNQLAAQIAHVYQDPGLLEQLGRQALQRANGCFTWARVAENAEAVYDRVLSASDTRAEDLALIDSAVDDLVEALQSARSLRAPLVEAAELIARSLAAGGQLLVCGNGGSAAAAEHLAAELVGRFRDGQRPGYAAHALTSDSATLTAWANDQSYTDIFARQVQAFGKPGDVLVGLSTSGSSPNVLRAFRAARRHGLRTVALIGGDGGKLRRLADLAIVVPATDTARIQECHQLWIHLISELIERRLAGTGGQEQPACAEETVRPLLLPRRAVA
ncbi:MAG: glycosyltransferase [Chloroflexi bacterium]|nr:glycosyltransferase [Chloroflexota bacterium]